jgi:hypothetical protein
MYSFLRWFVLLTCILALAVAADAQESQSAAVPKATILSMERVMLRDNIAHYRFDVVVGPGDYDKVRLHRVVKEAHPYQPVRTDSGALLLAGAPNYFEAMFLPPTISQAVMWDNALAYFLAKHDVDVWGMDYSWALVSADTTDFAFMKNWGVMRDTQHAETAALLARWLRLFTGQGFDRLHVLGFSHGGMVGYAMAGEETQWPRWQRNVKGLIEFDVPLKLWEKPLRDFYCGFAASDKANLDSGVYSDDTGLFVKQLSVLAITAPAEESPMLPGLNNYQAALFFGTSTPLLNGQFWHFVGGYLDENGTPSGLRFTEDRLWLDVLGNIPPHFPMRGNLDSDAVFCGKIPVPFDDHLKEITVPILYAGAVGGFGKRGFYTTTLTSSKDVTRFVVSQLPKGQEAMDFGHADMVLGRDANTLVWQKVVDWIVAHK